MDGSAMLAIRQRVVSLLVSLLVTLVYSSSATASSVIVGGSTLLTQSSADQLATWLGEGDLKLTNIFSHTTGDGQNYSDFHNKVDGKGRTFTIAEVTSIGASKIIVGGYNPQSWSSDGTNNNAVTDPERTAFLFNLSAAIPFELKEKLVAVDNNVGLVRTNNQATHGPSFGSGSDFGISAPNSVSSLDRGSAYQYSYGPAGLGGNTLLGTTLGVGQSIPFTIDRLEIFTVADVAPLPSAALVGFVLLGGFALTRGRRRQIGT